MGENSEINTLVIATIANEQLPLLIKALNKSRFYFTRIDSSGGLLYLSTSTLLIGIRKERYDKLMDLLHTYCKKQRTHIATQTQMETHFQPSQPVIIEAETGGANILTLAVEYFEQY
jgi:uncharacterized protein YaaQ